MVCSPFPTDVVSKLLTPLFRSSGIPSPPNQRPSCDPVPAKWSKCPFSCCPSSDGAVWSLFTPFLFLDPSPTHLPSLNRVLLQSSPLLPCKVHSDLALHRPRPAPPRPAPAQLPIESLGSASPPPHTQWSVPTGPLPLLHTPSGPAPRLAELVAEDREARRRQRWQWQAGSWSGTGRASST